MSVGFGDMQNSGREKWRQSVQINHFVCFSCYCKKVRNRTVAGGERGPRN